MRKIESSIDLVENVHRCSAESNQKESQLSLGIALNGKKAYGLKRSRDIMRDRAIRDLRKKTDSASPELVEKAERKLTFDLLITLSN